MNLTQRKSDPRPASRGFLTPIKRYVGWRSGLPILLAAIVITLTVTFATVVLTRISRARTEADAQGYLHGLALVMKDQVDRWFQSVELVQQMAVERVHAAGITSADSFRSLANTPEWHEEMEEWAKTFPENAVLSLVDDTGRVINSSWSWPYASLDVSDRDYIKALQSDSTILTYIGQPVLNKATGAPTIFIARKVLGDTGQIIGFVTVAVLSSNLENFYRDVKINDGMSIGLFRQDGALLARYPQPWGTKKGFDFGYGPVFAKLRAGGETMLHRRSLFDGADRYVAVKQSNKFPVVVTVSLTTEAALASWMHESTLMIMVALIMDLSVVAAAIFSLARVRATERLTETESYLARHDPLTGLGTRLLFNEEVGRRIATVACEGGGVAVLLVDLTRFKEVNDTLGHDIGDDLLKAVAFRLGSSLPSRGIIARLGGDEFAVIASMDNKDQLEAFANDLIGQICEPYVLGNDQVTIEASLGAALLSKEDVTADHLLRRADLALSTAKKASGRAYRLFLPEMDAELSERRTLKKDLRGALALGQFELAYQPLLDLRSNSIAGFEALLRWPHPQRGYVSPEHFIPLAEEIGLIGTLGDWVLRQACQTASTWPGSLKLAVNLSPVQFRTRDLVADVRQALRSTSFPAERLELEITESVLLSDTSATGRTLVELGALGLAIALDDFGTGYSSLSYLRKYPFKKIKIDRSFIRDMHHSPDCATIVETTLLLANRLGLTATAEGVETTEQLGALRAQGCTQAQGYLISRPVPAHQVQDFLRSQAAHLQAVA